MRFCDLKQKEVINCRDGARLGFVNDLIFEPKDGRIIKLIIPGPGKFFGCIGRVSEYVISFKHIVKIGEDIIIVNVDCEEVLEKCKD